MGIDSADLDPRRQAAKDKAYQTQLRAFLAIHAAGVRLGATAGEQKTVAQVLGFDDPELLTELEMAQLPAQLVAPDTWRNGPHVRGQGFAKGHSKQAPAGRRNVTGDLDGYLPS